ncbi:hypothetical protein D7V90_12045 [bacterium 1xD42-87]|nr:hypothetical protein D7V90_12045 [bacterium 1xD42-87]
MFKSRIKRKDWTDKSIFSYLFFFAHKRIEAERRPRVRDAGHLDLLMRAAGSVMKERSPIHET